MNWAKIVGWLMFSVSLSILIGLVGIKVTACIAFAIVGHDLHRNG